MLDQLLCNKIGDKTLVTSCRFGFISVSLYIFVSKISYGYFISTFVSLVETLPNENVINTEIEREKCQNEGKYTKKYMKTETKSEKQCQF